jgi:uncharacterized protein YjbI with pentapeptide repeats
MANQEQLDLLKQGRAVWNTWRKQHPSLRPDLSGADLSSADLSFATQGGAILREVFDWGTDLSEANLSGADLSGANLSGANLRRANLRQANLSGASLSRAYLSYANLSGADLSNTKLDEDTRITPEQIGQAKPGTHA